MLVVHTSAHTCIRAPDVPKRSLILLSDTLSCHYFHLYWSILLVSELVNISSCLSQRLQVACWHMIDAAHNNSIWILVSLGVLRIILCKWKHCVRLDIYFCFYLSIRRIYFAISRVICVNVCFFQLHLHTNKITAAFILP